MSNSIATLCCSALFQIELIASVYGYLYVYISYCIYLILCVCNLVYLCSILCHVYGTQCQCRGRRQLDSRTTGSKNKFNSKIFGL